MKKTMFTATAAAICGAIAATSAPASTVTPDQLVLESNKHRADGDAPGDIGGAKALGTISGPTQRITGIAGRIVSATDVYTFTSRSVFDMDFVNLADTFGDDIDKCKGFDSRTCSDGSAKNGVISADFILSGVPTKTFKSPQPAGTSIFSNVAAGTYTFTIDGANSNKVGSAYDVAITTSPVPVPAALPLLLTAFGAAGLIARRKRS